MRSAFVLLLIALFGIGCVVHLAKGVQTDDVALKEYYSRSAVVTAVGKDSTSYRIKIDRGATLEMYSKYDRFKVGDTIPHVNQVRSDITIQGLQENDLENSQDAKILGIVFMVFLALGCGIPGVVIGNEKAEDWYMEKIRRNNRRRR
ncbi:MAG: hypothetical protein WCQ26_13675 [Pseudanabaena sp. ELA748]